MSGWAGAFCDCSEVSSLALVFGVPAGAIGALTIDRTLSGGFLSGFLTGLGSTAADVLYACVGAFGVTLVSGFLTAHRQLIGTLGGTVIIILGMMILLRKPRMDERKPRATSTLALNFTGSFLIAIANPVTVAAFFTAFAAFGIDQVPNTAAGVWLVLGIGVGTALWWAALAGLTAWLGQRLKPGFFGGLNRVLGILMIGFGVMSIVRSFK